MFQVPARKDVLASVPTPDPLGIMFHPLKSFANFKVSSPSLRNGKLKSKAPFFNLKSIPLFMRADHIHTNFVSVSLGLINPLGLIIYLQFLFSSSIL
jgi:hypothetical protein